ncbi:MAG: hypothetical protein FWD61_05920 [Phycisphaerales bacterium]|nr:hypothetical protein [Phycisphaerales bacterium]
MRLLEKGLSALVLGVLVGVEGCGRGGGNDAVVTVDLNTIGDVQQLEPYVGKRVTLIGHAGLGENRRLATLVGREVVILTDVEKLWPETMAPRLIEVTGELRIDKLNTDKISTRETDRPAKSRGLALRHSQVVRWMEEEQLAEQ